MRQKIGRQSSKKIVKRFLFFPKILPVNHRDGELEKRWLETATISQWLGSSGEWWDGYFIDEERNGEN